MKKIFILIISIIILSGCGNYYKDNDWNSGVDTSGTERNSTVKMAANDTEYTLSFNLPDDILQYVSFSTMPIEYTQNGGTVAEIKFEKDDKKAILGTFSLYNINDYDSIKTEFDSVDNVVLRNEDINVVLTYKAMESIPFDENTDEYKILENYSLAIGDIFSTIILE